MKKTSTRLLATCLLVAIIAFNGYSQKVFRSTGTGTYSSYTIWEISTTGATGAFSAAPSGTVGGTNFPDKTCDVIIQNGHTVKLTATQTLKNLTINSGGALISDGSARTLRPYGTPGLVITNNGTLGGTTTGPDAIVLEAYGADTSSHGFTLTGTGVTQINRIRMAGGETNLTVVIDQNVKLTQTANYALTAIYNPTTTDNYTLTINAGKTVTLAAGTGYFHNGGTSGTAGGNYTYNINGTLDLSAATGNVSLTPLATSGSLITVNVNGTLKLGTGLFSADTVGVTSNPIVFGAVSLNVGNGGLVDASLDTSLKTGTEIGQYFILSGTGSLKRQVGTTGAVTFPIGTSATSYSPVILTNTGTADNFTVSLKNTFDNTPVLPTQVVNKQWTIIEQATGANITPAFGWVVADQATGFSPSGTVDIMNYVGSAWVNYGLAGPLTGAGTVTNPYIATSANGFTTFGNFGITNGTVLPVIFGNISATKMNKGVDVTWGIATEINTSAYIVEKSSDGRTFSPIATVAAHNLATYTYTDAYLNDGTNYYRVKALDNNGTFQYSAVVSVATGIVAANIKVYPNPVVNGSINLQLGGLDKGNYSINIYNVLGQRVYSKTIVYDGATSSLSMALPATVATGIYQVNIKGATTNLTKTVSVQ